MRCLAKDPADRPATADEIMHELDSLTMPIGLTPQDGGSPAKSAPPSRRLMLAAAAIGAVVLVTITALLSRSRPEPPATTVAAPPAVPSATPKDSLPAIVPHPPPQAAAETAKKANPVLTPAESAAIAAAVQKRVAAARTRDSIAKARLAEQEQRRLMDSIIAANSGVAGASTRGPRRVIIGEPRENRLWPEIPLVGRAIADSLRRMLRARSRQYALVDQDSVRSVLANQRNPDSVGAALSAELLASIQLVPTRGDSAYLLLQLYDLGADRRYRTRSAGGRPVPKSEVLANLDALLLQALALLDEVSRGPRKQ
jgi:hypothetical protein